jgi:hypothetical protein
LARGDDIYTFSHGIEKRKKVFLGICQTRKRCAGWAARMRPAYRRGRPGPIACRFQGRWWPGRAGYIVLGVLE